ncbi:MAG: VIT1/CCC1 transporter family protein [Chloroflexi bacterium]|nr:VIT1/CCC1 transporter family protein [Chloroflexota bacterium]
MSEALREIVFGVEDGLISVFGLVIGMAAGANSSFIVLLAGATGAIASAVSMSAGTYLSVKSERDLAQRELAEEAEEIRERPEQEEQEVIDFLRARGFSNEQIATVLSGTRHNHSLLLEFMAAHELQIGRAERADPLSRAGWMFVADLFAALFPVAPFALLPLTEAQIVSIGVTALALVALGVGRGLVTHRSVPVAVVETLGIAALAAGAGFAIARVISSWVGVQVPV